MVANRTRLATKAAAGKRIPAEFCPLHRLHNQYDKVTGVAMAFIIVGQILGVEALARIRMSQASAFRPQSELVQ